MLSKHFGKRCPRAVNPGVSIPPVAHASSSPMNHFRDAYTRNLDADQRGTRARNSECSRLAGNTLLRRSMGDDTTDRLVWREHRGYLTSRADGVWSAPSNTATTAPDEYPAPGLFGYDGPLTEVGSLTAEQRGTNKNAHVSGASWRVTAGPAHRASLCHLSAAYFRVAIGGLQRRRSRPVSPSQSAGTTGRPR
jgi:hypothetical protein